MLLNPVSMTTGEDHDGTDKAEVDVAAFLRVAVAESTWLEPAALLQHYGRLKLETAIAQSGSDEEEMEERASDHDEGNDPLPSDDSDQVSLF